MESAAPRACAYRDVRLQARRQPSYEEYLHSRSNELRSDYQKFLGGSDSSTASEEEQQGPPTDTLLALAGVCPDLAPGAAQWRQVFQDIYERHNPGVLPRLENLLEKYRGVEAAWWDALAVKYAFKDVGDVSSPKRVRFDTHPVAEEEPRLPGPSGPSAGMAATDSATGSLPDGGGAPTQEAPEAPEAPRKGHKTTRGCRGGKHRKSGWDWRSSWGRNWSKGSW